MKKKTGTITLIAFVMIFLMVNMPSAEQKGSIDRIKVHGKSLEGNLEGDSPDRQVSIYLPPSYDKKTDRKFPVLYILHGFTSKDDHWFGVGEGAYINIPVTADKVMNNGVNEMIIVMPNAFTKYHGSMYSSSVTTGDWEAFIAKDLVEYIDTNYRTIADRESRGLAGHSMGGYGTVRIGMKYPEVFSSLYSMSPCCMAPTLRPQAEVMARAAEVDTDEEIMKADFGTKAMLASAAAWSPNPKKTPHYFNLPIENGILQDQVIAIWAANAPLTMVHQYIPSFKTFKAIAMDVGDKDAGIAPTVKTLSGILSDYGIDHISEIYDGDHVNRLPERLEKNVLPFFSENLVSE